MYASSKHTAQINCSYVCNNFVVEFCAPKKLLQRLMFGIKCKQKQDVDLILMYIMCRKIKAEYMHVL